MRKTFDIKNSEVLKHLNHQHNQTKYIVDLILADIEGQRNKIDKAAVIEIIKGYLENEGIKKKDEDLTAKNAIIDILNLGKKR